MKKRLVKILIGIAAVLAVLCGAFFIYVSNYYHAYDSVDGFLKSDDSVVITKNKGRVEFMPQHLKNSTGIIFYPGGKVDYKAYAPLMKACAKQGYLCVLLHMPFNLAVFDQNAALAVVDDYSQIDTWYLAGHSLGGAMAASCAAKNESTFAGIILLAAYPVAELDIPVLSIYGSEDGVLNMKKYEAAGKYLPDTAREYVIQGGCHAGYAYYGPQKKDGEPFIEKDEQIKQTCDYIVDFVESNLLPQ